MIWREGVHRLDGTLAYLGRSDHTDGQRFGYVALSPSKCAAYAHNIMKYDEDDVIVRMIAAVPQKHLGWGGDPPDG